LAYVDLRKWEQNIGCHALKNKQHTLYPVNMTTVTRMYNALCRNYVRSHFKHLGTAWVAI